MNINYDFHVRFLGSLVCGLGRDKSSWGVNVMRIHDSFKSSNIGNR